MALSNAEKQARFRQRKQQKLDVCVTPDEVRRAARILHEGLIADWGEGWEQQYPSWDELAASFGKRGGSKWMEQLPRSADPDDYPACIPAEDRAFLAKVGALVRAVTIAPITDA